MLLLLLLAFLLAAGSGTKETTLALYHRPIPGQKTRMRCPTAPSPAGCVRGQCVGLGAEEAGGAESHLKREAERRTSTTVVVVVGPLLSADDETSAADGGSGGAGTPGANLSACLPVDPSKDATVATGQPSPWSFCAAPLGARESLRPTASGPRRGEERDFFFKRKRRGRER